MPSQEFEGVRPSHLSHLASKSRKQHSATWHMTIRPAIERAELCLALARHWDSQSAWHRRTGPGRRGTLRLAWAEPWPASLLGSITARLRLACRCRRAMTGGPGLDREDSSGNRRWRRAAEGQ